MKYVVLGKKPVNFTASDGREVRGTTIYVSCEADGVDGVMAEKLFVSADKIPLAGIEVGSEVDIYFNRYGKIDAIDIEL